MEGSESNQQPLTSKSKTSNKGLLIGLIVGIGAILIGGIVTVLILVLGGVSRADYRDAQDTAASLVNYIDETDKEITRLASSSSPTKQDIETTKSKLADFKKELKLAIEALGDKKAIKGDKEAEKKYDALKLAYNKFNEYIDLTIQLYDGIMPIAIDMIGVGAKFSAIDDDSQVRDLITELRSLATRARAVNTTSKVLNDSIHDMGNAMGDLATILEKGLNGNSDSTELMNNLNKATADLTDAAQRFQDEVTSLDKISDTFAEKINDLGEYLTAKANGE